MDDEKLAPEGGDAEGATADTESQPSPEGEGATQQQQPEPDPFADIPYEKVREYYADRFEEEAGQREGLGFSRGQGESRKEIAAIRKQDKEEEADRIAFRRLEGMRTSEDPEAADNFRREMADPNTRASYGRGQEAVNRPPPEVAERMRAEVADFFLNKLDAHLNDRKELQGLSDEEKAGLAKEKHPTFEGFVLAKFDLAVKRGIAAGVSKENTQKLQDAKEEGRREAYDEVGLGQPDEIKGSKPVKPDTDGVLAGFATGEQKATAFEKKHGYKPRGR